MIPRSDIQTSGMKAYQFFDVVDLAAGRAYDYTFVTVTGIPIEYAARYTNALNADGLPNGAPVPGTAGPIGGMICWPADSHSVRTAAQWGTNFIAKVTQASPLKVRPIYTGDGSGWTTDSNLDDLAAFSSGVGTAPALNDFVLCSRATIMGQQVILAFQGGGGGSSLIAFRVASAVGSGIYNGVQIDPVLGTDIGGGITTARLQEMNLSTNVGTGSKVYAQHETSGGNDYYVFVLNMGPCS